MLPLPSDWNLSGLKFQTLKLLITTTRCQIYSTVEPPKLSAGQVGRVQFVRCRLVASRHVKRASVSGGDAVQSQFCRLQVTHYMFVLWWPSALAVAKLSVERQGDS